MVAKKIDQSKASGKKRPPNVGDLPPWQNPWLNITEKYALALEEIDRQAAIINAADQKPRNKFILVD